MDKKGFTLIELVMILVLLGIMAAFVAPRLPNITGTKAGAFTDKLRADIRYAQNLAMTENRRTRVYFNGLNTAPIPEGYAVVIDTSATGNCGLFGPVADPSLTGNLIVTLNAGDYANVTVTPTTRCLEYDSLGRPYDCDPGALVCTAGSAGMSVAVNANAVLVRTVTVTTVTGAVN